ncbi:MAG: hypothetical protein ACE5LV_07265, partial [Candidatus Aminicenantales bacterium]
MHAVVTDAFFPGMKPLVPVFVNLQRSLHPSPPTYDPPEKKALSLVANILTEQAMLYDNMF